MSTAAAVVIATIVVTFSIISLGRWFWLLFTTPSPYQLEMFGRR